jgi:hypothetical protein
MTTKIITFPEHGAILLMHPYVPMHQNEAFAYNFRAVPRSLFDSWRTAVQIGSKESGKPLRFQVIHHLSEVELYGKRVIRKDPDFESSPFCMELFGAYESIEYAFDGEYLYVEIHDEAEQVQFLLTNSNYDTNF